MKFSYTSVHSSQLSICRQPPAPDVVAISCSVPLLPTLNRAVNWTEYQAMAKWREALIAPPSCWMLHTATELRLWESLMSFLTL